MEPITLDSTELEVDQPTLPGLEAWPYSDTLGGVDAWLASLLSPDHLEAEWEPARATAAAYRSALSKVLDAYVRKPWRTITLTEWDDLRDEAFNSFEDMSFSMNETSKSTYIGRVNNSIKRFIYAREETRVEAARHGTVVTLNGNYVGMSQTEIQAAAFARLSASPSIEAIGLIAQSIAERSAAKRARPMVDHKFPMLDGSMAEFKVPKYLTKADLKRITKFLDALTVEDDDPQQKADTQ